METRAFDLMRLGIIWELVQRRNDKRPIMRQRQLDEMRRICFQKMLALGYYPTITREGQLRIKKNSGRGF